MEFTYEELVGYKGWLYSRYAWKYISTSREHLCSWEQFQKRYNNEE